MPIDQSKIERAVAVTLPQKIKQLILGKEQPNLLTRVSVATAFLVWVYLFSWHLLTFLSLVMMHGLKPGWKKDVVPAFNRVGSKLYAYADTINTLQVHALAQFVVFFLMLLGLILIYRRKRIGFLFYIIGAGGSLLATLLIMGNKYFFAEVTMVDFALLIGSALYFAIGAWWFYRWKERKNRAEDQSSEHVEPTPA